MTDSVKTTPMPAEIPQFSSDHTRLWTATVLLPSWRGFQSRQGGYGTQDRETPSDGRVKIVFAPEGRGKAPLYGRRDVIGSLGDQPRSSHLERAAFVVTEGIPIAAGPIWLLGRREDKADA